MSTKAARPKLQRAGKEYKQMLESEGLEVYHWEMTGSAHYRMYCRAPDGRETQFIISNTPSDNRATLNGRALARRWLRQAPQARL